LKKRRIKEWAWAVRRERRKKQEKEKNWARKERKIKWA
jgi:hypothetical protein